MNEKLVTYAGSPKQRRPDNYSNCVPIVIRGVYYNSIREAARELGITRQAVSAGLDGGYIDRVGLGQGNAKRKPIRINGIEYRSIVEASDNLGWNYNSLKKLLRNARRLERLGWKVERLEKEK